jgi:RNA polymerase sigma-70 factor (ECF subfamily)
LELYNENELLFRVAQGNQLAFKQLVGYYTPIIFRHLLIYSKNVIQAEEITQDILLTIWNNRHKLEGMENFAGYVYVITRNRAHLIFRKKLLDNHLPPEDVLQHSFEMPENNLELKELQQFLLAGIELLSPKRREVFKLSRIENLSYEEIAERLSITRSTVRQQIIASLVFLRTYLKEEAGIVAFTLIWMHTSSL